MKKIYRYVLFSLLLFCSLVYAKEIKPDLVGFNSPFGAGFGAPNKLLPEAGINWYRMGTRWGMVEPKAPRERIHFYRWERLDQMIKGAQDLGLHMQMIVSASCEWAMSTETQEPYQKKARAPRRRMQSSEAFKEDRRIVRRSAPQDEYWDDYGEFIYNLVERYDGDGVNDMPGLREAIDYWEIESEAQNKSMWQGTVDEYIKLLRLAYTQAKKANPRAKIILAGFNFGEKFDAQGNLKTERYGFKKDGRMLYEVFIKSPPAEKKFLQQVVEFNRRILREKDYFDLVEFHANHHYLGIAHTISWIKREMQKLGYQKPIWAGDVMIGPHVAHLEDGAVLMQKMDAGDTETINWYRKEHTKLLVKKAIVLLANGAQRFFMENVSDQAGEPKDPTNKYIGLFDTSGKPKPAYYAYKLLISKLKGFKSIETQEAQAGLYLYRFFLPNAKTVYVAWSEEEKTVNLKMSSPNILVTDIFQQEKTYKPDDGNLNITLSSIPVFIESIEIKSP